jgi:hypothetical protein
MKNDDSSNIHGESHRQYRQSLGNQVNTVQQEARMILPGIQALFGFQLIAVFNTNFSTSLNKTEQIVHLIALLSVAVSAILVVAPAAYHRQANHQISKHFIDLSSSFLAWAMAPLAIGTCLDIFLVTRIVLTSYLPSFLVAGAIFALYAWTWFIWPKLRAIKIEDLPTHPLPAETPGMNPPEINKS